MERRDFFKKMGLFAAMFGIGGKLKAQDAQPAEKKADAAPKKTDTKLIFLGTAHGAVTPTRFHSATLLQVGGKNYLIDAGDAVSGQLTKNGFFLPDLNTVFITHPHLDHFGGLFMLIQQWLFHKQIYPRRVKEGAHLDIYLGGQDFVDTMKGVRKGYYRSENYPAITKLHAFQPGEIYNDGNIKVTAYGNDHMGRRKTDNSQIASSFLFECANGKKIFFSGDLSKEYDLPLEGIKGGVDLLVSELVHYPLPKAIERLKDQPIKKICFQHYGDAWERAGWQKRFADFSKQLTSPAEIVHDNDVRYV